MHLTGNTIFITGGGSGIGRGFAEAFHKLGNQVIISGRRQSMLDVVTAANPGMTSVTLDVSDPADVARVANTLIRDYPSLNVLFNNAGIMPFDDAGSALDLETTQNIIATNLLGPLLMTSGLIEHLKKKPRATVIYNSSVLAFVPLATNAVYSATKAAIHSYALSQRFVLRESHVTVQEIAPPWVDTDLIKKSGDPRAMPLDVFIEQAMALLATETPEIVVESIRALRDNPGAAEHALVTAFNQSIVDDPIPV